RTLQARDIVLQRSRIRVRQSFLHSVNHSVDTDAIVEDARTAPHDQSAIDYRLPCEPDAWSEVAQRNPIFAREHAIELPNSRRDRSPSAFIHRTRIVVLRHDVTLERIWVSKRRSRRWYWHGPEIAGPLVRQITVFICQLAEALPTDAKIEGQFAVDLPVILEKRGLVVH